ncbi:MAG: glycosyltransferase [Phycisphaerales bacterium]
MAIDGLRVLHLLDPGSAGGGPCSLHLAAAVVAGVQELDHDAVVLGTRSHAELARHCGVASRGNIPIPAGRSDLARAALRRVVHAIESTGPVDLIHAWTGRAAALAADADVASALPSSRIEFADGAAIMQRAGRRVPRTSGGPSLAAASNRAEEMALDAQRALPAAVDAALLPRNLGSARLDMRRRWRIGSDAFVVGLIGDAVERTSARTAVDVLALARLAGRPAHVVIHPAALGAARTLRWSEGLDLRRHITLEESIGAPWRVAAALDAGLCCGADRSADGGDVSALAIAWLALAAVPTVAERTDGSRAIVEDGRTGVLVPRGDHAAAASEIVRLIDDPHRRQRLGTQARASAIDRFTAGELVRGARAAYRGIV